MPNNFWKTVSDSESDHGAGISVDCTCCSQDISTNETEPISCLLLHGRYWNENVIDYFFVTEICHFGNIQCTQQGTYLQHDISGSLHENGLSQCEKAFFSLAETGPREISEKRENTCLVVIILELTYFNIETICIFIIEFRNE